MTATPEAIALTAVQGELAKAKWQYATATAEARLPALYLRDCSPLSRRLQPYASGL